MWSMKEAAYKAIARKESRRFFNPKLLQCRLQSTTLGTVQYNGVSYEVCTFVGAHYIYSTVNSAQYTYCSFPSEPKEVIGFVARALKLDEKALEIRKDNTGCPNAFYKDQQLTSEMTVTDHGDYWAAGFNILQQ